MRAKKSLGQNFLQDESVVERIVNALELNPSDTVIEIGPGRGALTEKLIEQAGKIIAVEFDRDMIAVLRARFDDRLRLVEGNVLDVEFSTLAERAKLVGNLPYNISSPIMQRLIIQRGIFTSLVLMLQREVVDRITAKPGASDRGYMTVLAEAAFEIERLFDVPPTAFRPVPKVWSAVIRLKPKVNGIADSSAFRDLISLSFAAKRKTILNNLKPRIPNAADLLITAKVDPSRRAETLTLDEWFSLTEIISSTKEPGH
jgi:16S rRNA (adenine1518-N6/adenine1519-N6)-dimethyltransferase